jgi:hypothetical protein
MSLLETLQIITFVTAEKRGMCSFHQSPQTRNKFSLWSRAPMRTISCLAWKGLKGISDSSVSYWIGKWGFDSRELHWDLRFALVLNEYWGPSNHLPDGCRRLFSGTKRGQSLKLATNFYLVPNFDILIVLPACEKLCCLHLEAEVNSSNFCLTVVRCLWWWCMYRKIIFKQIIKDGVAGTMVYCKMDSLSRILDAHDETWGRVTADNLLNSWIRTDCSRNVLYKII